MNARQEEDALFWCGLLAPVLFEGLDTVEERRQLRQLAQAEVVFPDGRKSKPSLSTTRRCRARRSTGISRKRELHV